MKRKMFGDIILTGQITFDLYKNNMILMYDVEIYSDILNG